MLFKDGDMSYCSYLHFTQIHSKVLSAMLTYRRTWYLQIAN